MQIKLLLALSAVLAVGYGIYGYGMYDGPPPYVVGTIFKTSGIAVLGLIALFERSRLLAAGLMFGALGDALLAWSQATFLYGSLAFLIGHLFYITLFLRSGISAHAALREPTRIGAMLAILAASVLMTAALVPRGNSMFAALAVYTGVLTLMTLSSFTLSWPRRLAMAGAVLFFVSDGFVAWNMFHHDPDPARAYWRSFAGWMIYWAGQAAICIGALGLRKSKAA